MNMKRFSIVLISLLVSLFTLGTLAEAAIFRQGQNINIASGQTVVGNLYLAGTNVVVNGRVKGDLFILADRVKIRGAIKGDIFVCAKQADIVPLEADDIHVVAKRVFIRGKIFNDIMTFSREANIGGNIYGCAYVFAKRMLISPYTRIRGDLEYSAQEALIPSTALIRKITLRTAEVQVGVTCDREALHRKLFKVALFWMLINILILIGFAGLLIRFFPNQVKLIDSAIAGSPWKCMGVGLLGIVSIPLLIIFLCILIFGIPFAAIIGIAYLVALFISKIFISIVLGELSIKQLNRLIKRFKKKTKPIKPGTFTNFVIGIILFGMICALPAVGPIFKFLSVLIGFGAILTTRIATYQLARKSKVL